MRLLINVSSLTLTTSRTTIIWTSEDIWRHRSVETHRVRIMSKLNLHNTAELTLSAVRRWHHILTRYFEILRISEAMVAKAELR